MSTSIVRPLTACATPLAPSTPTAAMTFTGTIKPAASAKYTADPPSVSPTLPKGPSRVSRATEPATRSSGRWSGTAPRTAARRDDVASLPKLLEEVMRRRVVLDLHPAASKLARSVRVRARRGDFAEVFSKPCSRLIGGRLTPGVVRLDDVDPVRQLHDSLGAEVRSMAVQWVRYVSEPTHFVNHVHHILHRQVGRQSPRDEQPDHLTLAGLRFLPHDGKFGRQLSQDQGSFYGVVVGQRDSVQATFGAALYQLLERAPAVMRIERVQMEIDPHRLEYR